jgi:predicted Zn-dependent protease
MNASARPSNKAVRKGLAHLNVGRIDDAERLFRSVLKSEPDNPDANHALGTLAVRQGNLPLALRFLTAALQANPREARQWLSFAEALLQSGSIGGPCRDRKGSGAVLRPRDRGTDPRNDIAHNAPVQQRASRPVPRR